MFCLLLNIDILIVFGILLLLRKDVSGKSTKIMGVTLFMYAVVLLRHFFHAIYHQEDYTYLYWLNIVFDFAGLFSTSMAGLYCILLTRNKLHKGEIIGLFLPPLLVWLPIVVLTLTVGRNGGVMYVKSTSFGDGTMPVGWNFSMLKFMERSFYINFIKLQAVVIAIYCWVQLHHYLKRLKEYYSVTGNKSEREDYFLYVSLSILYLIFIFFGRAPFDVNLSNDVKYELLYILSSILFFVLGYTTLKIQYTAYDFDVELADETPHDAEEPDSVADDPAPEVETKDYSLEGRLKTAMNVGQVFLKSDLTLDDLAKDLQTNRTYLSKLINGQYGESFSTYINKQRVEHAQNLLRTEPAATLEWVALKSGFVSYNSFYHTFKELVGEAPGVWRKQI